MDFKERFQKLHNVTFYATLPRFVEVLRRNGITRANEVSSMWEVWRKGIYKAIESELFTNELLDAFIAYSSEIDFSDKRWKLTGVSEKDFRKIVYVKAGQVISVECNLGNYEGIKTLCGIYEDADELLGSLKQIAEFPKFKKEHTDAKERMNVYEYDLFHTTDSWSKGDKVFIAIGSGFKELLYTQKYGYLTARGDANYDSEEIKFPEEMVNLGGDEKSEYAIERNSQYNYMGNLLTDKKLLHNTKQHEVDGN